MSETDTPTMLTDQDIQDAAEAYRGLTQQRRMLERADPILKVVLGASHYLGASRREADKVVATAELRAGEIVANAERKAESIEARIPAAETRLKQLLDEAAMINADNERARGEQQDLANTKAKLVSNVARLTKTVADLEAIR